MALEINVIEIRELATISYIKVKGKMILIPRVSTYQGKYPKSWENLEFDGLWKKKLLSFSKKSEIKIKILKATTFLKSW